MNSKSVLLGLSFFLATCFYATPSLALGGGGGGGASSGGGSDFHEMGSSSAWFLGANTPVRTCFEVSISSGVTIELARQSFRRATEVWAEYIQRKRINEFLASSRNPEVQLSTQYLFLDRCDGSEELTLLVGVTNPLVQAQRAAMEHPLGFSHRTEYDPDTGRGKGFIWINGLNEMQTDFPASMVRGFSWTSPYRLSGMLIHELGHVLGCGHATGTIMREDIAWLITDFRTEAEWARPRLDQIDHTREFFACLDSGCNNSRSYRGFLTQSARWPRSVQQTFRLFVGRNPQGPVQVALEAGANPNLVTLLLQDQVGTRRLPVFFPNQPQGYVGEGNAFHVYRQVGNTTYFGGFRSVSVSNAVFFANDARGQRRTLIFSENADLVDGPLAVTYFDGNETHLLLDSTPEWARNGSYN